MFKVWYNPRNNSFLNWPLKIFQLYHFFSFSLLNTCIMIYRNMPFYCYYCLIFSFFQVFLLCPCFTKASIGQSCFMKDSLLIITDRHSDNELDYNLLFLEWMFWKLCVLVILISVACDGIIERQSDMKF